MRLSIFPLLAAIGAPLFAGPYFELLPLNVPSKSFSAARAINDHNEVVGTIELGQDRFLGFHWKDGVVTMLPAFDGNSVPNDINNRGEIVGYVRADNTSAAWHRTSSGENRRLLGWEAFRMNNHGDIVGRVGNAAYLISAEPPVRLSADTGIPWGINDSRVVVGQVGDRGFLSRDFQPVEQTQFLWPNLPASYMGTSAAKAISSNGIVVGAYGLYYYDSQPAVWTGTDWRVLGTRLHKPGFPVAVNSAGTIVGTQYPAPTAVLWTPNGLGYSLDHLTSMPEGTFLSDVRDINDNGWIAATAVPGGAAVLKPLASLDTLPVIELAEPAQVINHTGDVTASVNIVRAGAPLRSVTYYLFWRTRSDNFNAGPDNVRFTTWGPSTNVASKAPFSFTFENLEPRQYVISAHAEDETGLKIYLPPKHFLVTGPGQFEVVRQRFDRTLDLGFAGAPGRMYRLETSEDLRRWTPLDLPPTQGGNFAFPGTSLTPRFYRAAVHSEDPEIFGGSFEVPWPESHVNYHRLELRPAGSKTPIVMDLYWGRLVVKWPDRNWDFEGTYEQLPLRYAQGFRMTTPGFSGELELQLAIPRDATNQNEFRAEMAVGEASEIWTGTYTLEMH